MRSCRRMGYLPNRADPLAARNRRRATCHHGHVARNMHHTTWRATRNTRQTQALAADRWDAGASIKRLFGRSNDTAVQQSVWRVSQVWLELSGARQKMKENPTTYPPPPVTIYY